MANKLYDHGREAFGNAGINWLGDTIKGVLVNTSAYHVDLANDRYYADLSGIQGNPATFSGKTNVAGVMDADDLRVLSVPPGPEADALVIFKWTGTGSTSPLIAYIDSAAGLPIVPNGDDILVSFDSGPNRIFKL